MKFLCEVLDIQNYILMGFNINECFYDKFWANTIIFKWDSILWSFLWEILDIHNYILMGFYINEVFYEKVLDKHNYILMGFNINDVFYEKFWINTIIF